MEVEIRRMKFEDIGKVSQIIEEDFKKYDAKDCEDTIEFHFKCHDVGIEDGRKYWVAEADGKIIGLIGWVNTVEGVFWISWFCVAKNYQGHGIGTELLTFLTDRIKERGADMICAEASSLPMFEAADKMYEDFGFEEKFRIDDYWADGDDLILYAKDLR